MKYVLVIGDGMADDPLPELGGKTPLEACDKPYFDSLCRRGVLGLVHQIQTAPPYHGAYGVRLEGSPDYAAIAAAYGIPSIVLEEESQVEPALDRFLSQPGSCLLIARVDPAATTGE